MVVHSEAHATGRRAMEGLIGSADLAKPAIGTVRVDPGSGALRIGLLAPEGQDLSGHRETFDRLTQGHPYELHSVRVLPDNTTKKQYCSPVWGGVRSGLGTLTLVVTVPNGYAAILSAHSVGVGVTGQTVGQPTTGDSFGVVTVNPPMSPQQSRLSDSALAAWTNGRRERTANAIWATADSAYTVTQWQDGPIDGLAPVAMQDGLSQGEYLGVYDYISDGTVFLADQCVADYAATGGDSGGPVFQILDPTARTVNFLGIHAGRIEIDDEFYPYFSPWEGIKDELGL